MITLIKSYLLLSFLIICNFASHSQIDFEQGYYIDNSANKLECLIKNVDWDVNPMDFLMKKSVDEQPQRVTIGDAAEFGIYGKSRFVRATVDLDRSSDKIEDLSVTRAPEFRKEQIFLKVLVEGSANLYEFFDGIRRFYYQADTMSIRPLVYKQYRYNETIHENLTFREQLYNLFSCGTPRRSDVDRARYSQRDLTKLFIQYNDCLRSPTADYSKKQSPDFFNLWLRPRLTLSSFSASRNSVSDLDFDFGNQVRFSGGIEAEFVLPFNRNKWAIIIEPTFQSYDASIPSEPIKVDYQALELPIGLRHYFFLNNSSKISLAFAFQLSIPFDSQVTHHSNVELVVTGSSNMAFEAGYVFKNRLCIAYRLQVDRELLGDYPLWRGDFNTMAFVVGYSFF